MYSKECRAARSFWLTSGRSSAILLGCRRTRLQYRPGAMNLKYEKGTELYVPKVYVYRHVKVTLLPSRRIKNRHEWLPYDMATVLYQEDMVPVYRLVGMTSCV